MVNKFVLAATLIFTHVHCSEAPVKICIANHMAREITCSTHNDTHSIASGCCESFSFAALAQIAINEQRALTVSKNRETHALELASFKDSRLVQKLLLSREGAYLLTVGEKHLQVHDGTKLISQMPWDFVQASDVELLAIAL